MLAPWLLLGSPREVVSADGDLVFRQVFDGPHLDQPFTSQAESVPIETDVAYLYRVHMHPHGYGGAFAFRTQRESGPEAPPGIGTAFPELAASRATTPAVLAMMGPSRRRSRAVLIEVRRDESNWPGLHPGNRITVQHDDGSTAIYAHLNGDGMRVSVGDVVRGGQPLGESGMSGYTIYPHLHFQTRDSEGAPSLSSFREVDEVGGFPQLFGIYTARGLAGPHSS